MRIGRLLGPRSPLVRPLGALGILAGIVALILSGAGVTAVARRNDWDLPTPPNPFGGTRAKLTSQRPRRDPAGGVS